MSTANGSAPTNGFPKLRPLDIRRHTQEGRLFLLLRDPLQLSDQMLLIPQPLASVLAFCDGSRDETAMAAAFADRFQMPIETAVVSELIRALDEALLLDNDRSQGVIEEVVATYRDAPFRPPALAGSSYPSDPTQLHALLQDYLEGAPEVGPTQPNWPERIGILSPHIDYPRGGEVYAQVWKAAAQAAVEADLVILLGTDHASHDPFTLTRQNYATPYGVLPTAQPMVDALAEVIGHDAAFAGELRHRDEHSLELVAVWLHHMRGGRPVELVPILVGSLQHPARSGGQAGTESTLEEVLATLDKLAADRRVLVVASGDLAHVGPAFGGTPLNGAGRKQVRAADSALLDAMRAGDSEAFVHHIDRVSNRNNVCGVSPIYLTMRLVGRGALDGQVERDTDLEYEECQAAANGMTGVQFGYAECPADEYNTSMVTVAGMIFTASHAAH